MSCENTAPFANRQTKPFFKHPRYFNCSVVILQKLRLYNFKNYGELSIDLGGSAYCLFGKNGSGKTNLLDAIYYLSFTKSAVTADGFVVKKDETQFLVKGEFLINGHTAEVTCAFSNGKKTIQENGQTYSRFSEHIGRYPTVWIAPQDIELIWGGGELRRKFFDSLICQLDRQYLEMLIVYTHQLKQRNSLLKLSHASRLDRDLLATYDQRLTEAGNYIYHTRKNFLQDFLPAFATHYRLLSDVETEPVSIQYNSELDTADFGAILKQNIERDLMLQRTTSGVHRDEFSFLLADVEIKKTGSQGQQKSFLIGLKLAEFDTIAQQKQMKPILLLDDIFDKLDDTRIRKLIELVAKGTFGQLFITDARPDRSREILSEAGIKAEVFTIESGKIVVS